MSSDRETAITAQNVSKIFRVFDNPRNRLKQWFSVGGGTYYEPVVALDDISFEVKRGETLGVVGRNGSGKSTLLQIICGTLRPTTGCVETNGRISALLELGSGFSPEFTGVENVELNGTLLGLTREEIDSRMDQILAFADVGDFAYRPVKTYSSGMLLRLAFAVQAQVEPEVLIVDEALAVGDSSFQAKCFRLLEQLKDDGCSILLVTHVAEQIVSHCDRALLLDGGCVQAVGKPTQVINRYNDLSFRSERSISSESRGKKIRSKEVPPDTDDFSLRRNYNKHEFRWGDQRAVIYDFELLINGSEDVAVLSRGDSVQLNAFIKFNQTIELPIFGFVIKNNEGISVYGVNTESCNYLDLKFVAKKNKNIKLKMEFECYLAPGDYFISLGLAAKDKAGSLFPCDRRYDAIKVSVVAKNLISGFADLNLNFESEIL
jgi:lipopolysaccharide transport system ATP-binding protein